MIPRRTTARRVTGWITARAAPNLAASTFSERDRNRDSRGLIAGIGGVSRALLILCTIRASARNGTPSPQVITRLDVDVATSKSTPTAGARRSGQSRSEHG
jgi:hypothetical protein